MPDEQIDGLKVQGRSSMMATLQLLTWYIQHQHASKMHLCPVIHRVHDAPRHFVSTSLFNSIDPVTELSHSIFNSLEGPNEHDIGSTSYGLRYATRTR